MGCGFKINNQDLIIQLLTTDFSDLSTSKETDLCSWTFEFNVNNLSSLPSKLTNTKITSKPNAVACRSFFGYKTNNKVNNYNFRHYKTSENYVIQYRNENKSQRCLPYNNDFFEVSPVFPRVEIPCEMPTSIMAPQKLSADSQERPLIHQVRFWQNQNPLIQPVGDVNAFGEGSRTNNALQIGAPVSKSNNINAFAQRCRYRILSRSTFNTKRNLDVMVPQGTTYDILSDDNRINNKEDADKLNIKINDDGPGLVGVPYSFLRESTKIKRFTKEGGSLEFAKLLDEKLRQLYEHRNLYQPIIEINRLKPETRQSKPILRLKSANQIKEKCNPIMFNHSLHGLSVNGQSAASKYVNPSQKLLTSSESQCTCCMPCLLPQMPAFGTHNFPRFILYHKCSNMACQMNQHEE